MTVGELIKKLQKFDENETVLIVETDSYAFPIDGVDRDEEVMITFDMSERL